MPERKTALAAVALVSMAVLAVPSVVLVDSCREYFTFLNNWSGGMLRRAGTESAPAAPRAAAEKPPEMKYIKFSLSKSTARKVGVAADFNKWDAAALPLKKTRNGSWEALVPLPRGKYGYLFDVDGKLLRDPANSKTRDDNGKTVSLLSVQ